MERVYYAERRHPFPEMLGCIIADALHNLRSALDHVAFTLVKDVVGISDETVLNRVHFPVAIDKPNFEGIVTARLASGLYCARVADLFRRHQPYVAGTGERIYTLNRLDRFDKHCDLIDVRGAPRPCARASVQRITIRRSV